MNTITREYLEEIKACIEAIDYFDKENLEITGVEWIKKLVKEDKLSWANWFIVRIMTYKQYVSYAVFSAEQVIKIYEKKYPKDDRPRKAIEAAKKCIENPSKENKYAAACAAADAAYATAHAADAAAFAAHAADAADAAFAAHAAADAAHAADAAACAAADAAGTAFAKLRTKILKHGIKLLKEKL